MTWARLLSRNGICDGDYVGPPERHAKRVETDPAEATTLSPDATRLMRYDTLAVRVEEYESAFRMLAGDIRRLECDAVDEGPLCQEIARRAGVEPECVAVVLKEFFKV